MRYSHETDERDHRRKRADRRRNEDTQPFRNSNGHNKREFSDVGREQLNAELRVILNIRQALLDADTAQPPQLSINTLPAQVLKSLRPILATIEPRQYSQTGLHLLGEAATAFLALVATAQTELEEQVINQYRQDFVLRASVPISDGMHFLAAISMMKEFEEMNVRQAAPQYDETRKMRWSGSAIRLDFKRATDIPCELVMVRQLSRRERHKLEFEEAAATVFADTINTEQKVLRGEELLHSQAAELVALFAAEYIDGDTIVLHGMTDAAIATFERAHRKFTLQEMVGITIRFKYTNQIGKILQSVLQPRKNSETYRDWQIEADEDSVILRFHRVPTHEEAVRLLSWCIDK